MKAVENPFKCLKFIIISLTRAPSFNICAIPGAFGTDKAIFASRYLTKRRAVKASQSVGKNT